MKNKIRKNKVFHSSHAHTHKSDRILLAITGGLVFLGLVILATASVVASQEQHGQSYYYLKHQFVSGVLLGFIALLITSKICYKYWQKLSLAILIASLILIGLVFVPALNVSHGGATRWLKFGPINFQPAEIAKLAFIIYLAAILDKKKEKVTQIKEGIIPFLVIISILSILLLCQPNFSALVLIATTAFVVLFLAGAKIGHLITIGLLTLGSFVLLIFKASYRMDRLTIFLHPELDPQGIGYQINQALLAIGVGGLFGRGLGHSIQRFSYLPEAIGDSIFAIAAEELGLIGAIIIIVLFLAFAWRGFKIAKNAPDGFSRLVASGITFLITFQAFFNIAAISGLMPLTGIPLPFISYGGTSLVVLLAGVGILLNISRYTVKS